MSKSSLATRLRYRLDLRIPHFEHTVPLGAVQQYSLTDKPTIESYIEFRDAVIGRVGLGHLPVLRFGDGECVFSVGYKLPLVELNCRSVVRYVKTFLSAYLKHRLQWNFKSGTPDYGYELYSRSEWKEARSRFVVYVRSIAESGFIGFNFVVQYGIPFCDRYIEPVCDWLDESNIEITERNFIPCYFVYALLLGPDRRLLLTSRHVLVVTALSSQKEELLRAAFYREGVASVSFLPISRSRSMFDEILFKRDKYQRIDLVLIGAGVGASHVINQLRHLNAVCIDAGYALDCYAQPALKGTRVFTQPDDHQSAANPA